MITIVSRHHLPRLTLLAMSLAVARPALAYESEALTNGGTINGRVRVVGEVVLLPPQPVYKHVAECGSTVRDDRLAVDRDRMLQYAVVTVGV